MPQAPDRGRARPLFRDFVISDSQIFCELGHELRVGILILKHHLYSIFQIIVPELNGPIKDLH